MTAFWVPLKLCTYAESPPFPTTLEGANMTAMEDGKYSCSKRWRLKAKWGALLERSAFKRETGLTRCNCGHADWGYINSFRPVSRCSECASFHWEMEASLPHFDISNVQLVKYLRLMFS